MISVIVPVYNTEEFLSKCIESILSQEYTDFELLLIDDGSTDCSLDICNRYASQDERIKVFHKENGGPSSARNLGVDHAVGEFVVFVDSDDWVTETYLSDLINNSYNDIDLVISGITVISNGHIKKKCQVSKRKTLSLDSSGLKDLLEYFSILNMLYVQCLKLFKKDIIVTNGIRFREDLNLGEDLRFNLDYLAECKKITLIPQSNYFYRVGERESLSSNTSVLLSISNVYSDFLVKKQFLIKKNLWQVESKESLYDYLMKRIVDRLFHLGENPTYSSIADILSCKEIKDMRQFAYYFKIRTIYKYAVLYNIPSFFYIFFRIKSILKNFR